MECKWAAGHTLGGWKWWSFCRVCNQKYKCTVRVTGVKSFGTWTLNKGWKKKIFICTICIKCHWKTESLSGSLTIQTLKDIFIGLPCFAEKSGLGAETRAKEKLVEVTNECSNLPPTLWNTGFLLHNLPPTVWNRGFQLHSSFEELYLCSVILFPQKPQVGWHCLYFPPEIWELESLRKFPRNPWSNFSCQTTEPLFFNIFFQEEYL